MDLKVKSYFDFLLYAKLKTKEEIEEFMNKTQDEKMLFLMELDEENQKYLEKELENVSKD